MLALNQQFKEMVRVKKALLVYFIACLVCALMIIAIGLASSHHTIVEGAPDPSHLQHKLPIALLWLLGAFPAAIMATVLGFELSSENAHTLAWAWTRPVSRTSYMLGLFVVDVIALVAAYFIGVIVLEFLILAVFNLFGYFEGGFGALDILAIVRGIAFPIAVYFFTQALTASLKRPGGMVAGLCWVVFPTIAALGDANLGEPFGTVFRLLNIVNPWHYVTLHYKDSDWQPVSPQMVALMSQHSLQLFALAAAALLAVIPQWNRLEA